MFDVAAFHQKRKSSFGENLFYLEQLESTNDLAEELAREGCSEGTVVIANEQTQGRGRKGAPWFSPPDLNLYCSIVFRPPSRRLQYLPYIGALAMMAMLKDLQIDADLKWPNDVLVKEKKISGILIQSSIGHGENEYSPLYYAVMGCGINVNVMHFPEDIAPLATSIAREKGLKLNREAIFAMFLQHLEIAYYSSQDATWDEFAAGLESQSSYLRGCPVRVKQEDGVIEGITAGLDPFGGLIVNQNGSKKIVYAGEVQECRKS